MNTPKAEGLPIPTVMEEFSPDIPDRTTLVLPLITMEPDLSGKSHEKSHETSQVSDSPSMASKADEILRRTEAVLSAIRSNPNVKTPSIAKALDLSDRKVRTVLEHMKQQHIVHFEGSGKGGHWVIDQE